MKTNLKKLIKFDFIKKGKVSENFKHGIALIFFAGLLLIGLGVYADYPTEFSAEGYAYGSIDDGGTSEADTGIGYISFGCTNDGSCGQTDDYGVRINTDPNSPNEGKFSGYAWSSNYGWISFNHEDVSVCGAEGGLEINGDVQDFIQNDGQTQVLVGSARVLHADNETWDGCIHFSGETQDNDSFATNITKVGSELHLSGWAWGSPIIGWVSFDCEYCGVAFVPNDTHTPGGDVCPPGTIGTPPDCVVVDPPVCPPGTIGTPPNCDTCPPGSLDPNCNVCPPGTTGTPPDCDPIPPGESNVQLYIEAGGTPMLGNTTDTVDITNPDDPIEITLLPVAYGVGVQSCSATFSNADGATVSSWNNNVVASLGTLLPNDFSNEFDVTISGYTESIITFTIQCVALNTGTVVEGEAFLTIGFPEPSVDIYADSLVVEPGGSTNLGWTFSNVQDNSCQIMGEVDFTPASEDPDPLTPMSNNYASSIGLSSFISNNQNQNQPWNTIGNPENYFLSGISFPMHFTISCMDFDNQPISDDVMITTTLYDCTTSMEAAGVCDNDIDPIFEEF